MTINYAICPACRRERRADGYKLCPACRRVRRHIQRARAKRARKNKMLELVRRAQANITD